MLLLSSNGLSSKKLITETSQYTNNMTNAAIITTASVGYKENDKHIPRIINELQVLGLTCKFFDIEYETPKQLDLFDMIVINGGNPFFLLKHLKKWNCNDLFRKYAESKIIIGISAGSIVLQNSIELIASYSPEMNETVNLTDLTGLQLTNIEILPHYNKFISRFEHFEKRADEYERMKNISLYRLDDGQAVFITRDKTYIV